MRVKVKAAVEVEVEADLITMEVEAIHTTRDGQDTDIHAATIEDVRKAKAHTKNLLHHLHPHRATPAAAVITAQSQTNQTSLIARSQNPKSVLASVNVIASAHQSQSQSQSQNAQSLNQAVAAVKRRKNARSLNLSATSANARRRNVKRRRSIVRRESQGARDPRNHADVNQTDGDLSNL